MDTSTVIVIIIALFALICVAAFVVSRRQAKAKDKALLSTGLEPEADKEPVRGVVIEESESREDDLVAEDRAGRGAEVESVETKDDILVSSPPPTEAGPDMAKPQGCKVLAIDDYAEMAELMKLILSIRGDDVRVAMGGYEGLSLAQQDPPDLIFIKLMMPDLDGYEVCRRLKEMQGLKDIPIVLHSASPAKAKAPFAQLAGAAGYLEYPLDPKALLDTRDAALRGETYYPSLAEKSETES